MISPPLEFTTTRLHLRPFLPTDATSVFAYASDVRVTKYMDWLTHTHLSDSESFIQTAIDERNSGDQYTWAIADLESGHLMGAISCSTIKHKVSFGYVLAHDNWHKGYASEAAETLTGWIIAQPEVHRVWAVCDIENVGSAKVLAKIGFTEEGKLAKWEVRPNLPGMPVRDVRVFALT